MGHLFNLLYIFFIFLISSKAEVSDYENFFSTIYPNTTIIEPKQRLAKLVTVQDNHKPTFTKCPGNATVKEEQSRGTHVLTVTATDNDPPENGGFITYSILKREGDRDYFSVNNVTGEITTQVIFDRDDLTQKEKFITVKATDNGRPILEDLCTIKITILDINDNAPIFDKATNEAQVSEDLKPNGEVMRILAYDLDDGDNSRLTYSFENSLKDFQRYFRIDSNTGVIYLKEALTGKRGTVFQSSVKANDNPSNKEETQRHSTAEIKITVVDSKKQPPTITTNPQNITLLENYTDFSSPLFQITAKSNIKNSEVQFELLKGQTRQTNSINTFILNSNGSKAVITLARPLDYETVTDYRLTVRVTNTDSLIAIATLIVNVEDVNDEFPNFIELVSGSVLENERNGTEVMIIKAIDKDITSPNNLVSYTLESHTDLFDIDPDTGRVTTKVEFDREEIEIYQIKVTAKDGAPSSLLNNGQPNMNTQTFRVKIEDKNDNKPHFTEAIYLPQPIPENVDEGKDVIEVKADDKDTASLIEYSIINGNAGDSFYIENTTGRIKVKNKLDYEKIESYILTVRAFDGHYSDECEVHIQISNVNDELPIFEPIANTRIVIQEESIPSGCIITVEAYDPDIKDRSADQKIVYRIGEEQRKFADVNKEGCVTLKKALDRDRPNGAKEYQVYIHAYDDDDGPNSKSNHLEIYLVLEDINDNAPFLNITEVVWYENQSPGGDIVKLTADDYDSENNSAPFSYVLAATASDDIRSKLSISNGILKADVEFDREQQKYYDIPIDVTDSGTPPQTATSILRLIIGDINDNAAQNGASEIFVYNYKGSYPNIDIGRVYVEDKDDWDLADKVFQWEESKDPDFLLNHDNGTITMVKGITAGTYKLKFLVTEEGEYIERHVVNATVVITVKDIPEEAVRKSGSIRLRGTTAEKFVTIDVATGKSQKEVLHAHLAKILNASLENVDVFTVLPTHKNESYYVDVRFSAHGSPYYLPERLNDKVSEHEAELERLLSAEFIMININECFDENTCPDRHSCNNELHIDNLPAVVFTNKTSFVGVKAIVEPACGSTEITLAHCYNGGTFTETGTCICLEGFDGPYCEILGIGFRGDGWALYRSFEAFEKTNIRLEMTAEKDDGLIFYIGPTNVKPEPIVRDFMSLELRRGFATLLLNYGSETIKSVVTNKKLSDGHVHSISILLTNKSIELRVDDSPSSDGQAINEPQNSSVLLNVNGPLQIGGTKSNLNKLAEKLHWEDVPTLKGFSGCVRNFTYNSYTYNLGQPAVFKNAIPNCNYGVSTAVFGIDSNFLVAILVCAAILIILLLAVVVHRRKHDSWPEKDTDDIRETIISYEDEGGGEGDTAYDLTVLRQGAHDDIIEKDKHYKAGGGDVPNIGRFLEGKKNVCDHDPNNLPYDNVRYYAYEGDGNSTGSLSSLASCTDDGDLKFNYLSSFGPRFRKLADMYGEPPNSDDDSNAGGEESWI